MTSLNILGGTLHISNVIGQRSTCNFIAYDDTGGSHFQQGQPILLYDMFGNLAYAGFVASSQEVAATQGSLIEYSVTGMDPHYLADKRRAVATYAATACGTIVKNLIDTVLIQEGVASTHSQACLAWKPSGFYKLADAAPGTSPVDSSGNANTGTKHGTITFGSTTLLADGSGDTSALFDGSTGYVTVPTTGMATGHAPWSLHARVQLSANPSGTARVVMGQGTWGTTNQVAYLQVDTSGKPGLLVAGMPSALSTTALSLNAAHDLLGTYDGSFLRLYVDGVLVASSTAFTANIVAGAASIGASPTGAAGTFLAGLIAYASFYATCLTAWQAMQLTSTGKNQTVQAGATPNAFTTNYGTVAASLDALAQYSSFYWQIDQYRVLWFAARGLQLAPLSVTTTITERNTVSATHANPQYRNQQYVLGGTNLTSAQTETRQGDGKATAFLFSYPLGAAPSALTVNGVAKTFGIKGASTGKDWYYAVGDPALAQDPGGTKLLNTDTLSMTYQGIYPVVTISSDNAQQATNQATEGGTTTGIVEDVFENTALTSQADAFLAGNAKLAAYSQAGLKYVFTTSSYGFAPGQVVTVTDSAHAITAQKMLIEQVDIADSGPRGGEIAQYWYTVTCLIGPANMNWVQFFATLAQGVSQPQNNTINVGSSATLVVAQTYNGTWPTWTGTLTASVFACPICGPATLCGPGTIVC